MKKKNCRLKGFKKCIKPSAPEFTELIKDSLKEIYWVLSDEEIFFIQFKIYTIFERVNDYTHQKNVWGSADAYKMGRRTAQRMNKSSSSFFESHKPERELICSYGSRKCGIFMASQRCMRSLFLIFSTDYFRYLPLATTKNTHMACSC